MNMPVLGVDLGGTKLASALFDESGTLLSREVVPLEHRTGADVGALITGVIEKQLRSGLEVRAIGVSVPGIAHASTGRVWAPNIPGWDDYPLRDELREFSGIDVYIDSDRGCAMLGECWRGNARGCRDAIYLAVGTGIGAGILVDGKILRGSHDIGGAVGWLALDKPFQSKYTACGCFEYYASGDGIARLACDLLSDDPSETSALRMVPTGSLSARHVFDAFERGDALARKVFDECVQYWGMAVANLISIFNPEKVIFGGGVFGPALRFLDPIMDEARKWAQPISINQVRFEASGLHGDAAIYGAGCLAMTHLNRN